MLPGAARLHPVLPRQLERGLDRLGATTQRIDQIEVAGREPRDLGGQLLDGVMGEGGAADVGDLSSLARERLRYLA